MLPDLAFLFPETLGVDEQVCGAFDSLTLSTCTRPAHADIRHTDDSAWDVVVHWSDVPTLLVPGA